jgi:hypothetical protein
MPLRIAEMPRHHAVAGEAAGAAEEEGAQKTGP